MFLYDPIVDHITAKYSNSIHLNYWKISDLKGKVKSVKTSFFQTHVIDGDFKFAAHLSSFLKYYTESGHIRYALSLDEENNVLWEYLYIWDMHKKLLRCKCLNSEKKIVEIYSYHFNKTDEMVCKRCYSPGGKLLWEYRPQKSGKESFSPHIEHFFDESGEEVERRETSPGGSTYIRTFEYLRDHHQNWIKKIERTKPLNNITSITKRRIEYYGD